MKQHNEILRQKYQLPMGMLEAYIQMKKILWKYMYQLPMGMLEARLHNLT